MTQQGDYRINYEPLFGPLQLIDVGEAIKRADHPWYNQTLIEVGGAGADAGADDRASRRSSHRRLTSPLAADVRVR
jgi:hypothetical protein